jgi:hypothetical protein
MRVIFFDIDGVLNCDKTPNRRKLPYVVDARLLERLQRLLALTSAKVVLTSTWRYAAGLFAAHYWGIPFVDVIPDMPDQPRREEILAWLRVHPNVLRYAVIDDEDDELDDLPLFQPLARDGLSNGIVEGVTAYLEGRTDEDNASSINPRTLVFSALEAFNILTRTSKGFLRTDIEPNLLEALARFPMFLLLSEYCPVRPLTQPSNYAST